MSSVSEVNFDLAAARTATLQDLCEQIPVVEVEWFIAYILPGLRPGLDFDNVLATLEADPHTVQDGRWAMFSAYPMSAAKEEENDAFKLIAKLFLCISQAAKQQNSIAKTVRLVNISTKPLGQTTRDNTSGPDGVAVLIDDDGEIPDPVKWTDVAIASEFKTIHTARDAHDNHTKMLWSMTNIMRDDPRRRFVLGFSITDCQMRLWFASRSNVVVSTPFDFMKRRDLTVKFFLSISYATQGQLGYDQTTLQLNHLEAPGSDVSFDIDVTDKDGTVTRYRTVKLLSNISTDALPGRGTRVWLVWKVVHRGEAEEYETKDGCRVHYVLKDGWIDAGRTPEGDIRREIYNCPDEDIENVLHAYLMRSTTDGLVYVRARGDDGVEADVEDNTHAVMVKNQQLLRSSKTLLVPAKEPHAKSNVHEASVRQPGDGRTGTPQFDATVLLLAIASNKPFQRTAAHDLESFCWVLIHAAYQRALLDAGGTDKEALQAENDRLFDSSSIAMLIERRADLAVPYKLMATSDGTQSPKAVPHHAIVGLVQFYNKGPWWPISVLLRAIWWHILCAQPRPEWRSAEADDRRDAYQKVMSRAARAGLPGQQLPPDVDATPALGEGSPLPPGEMEIGNLALTHEQLLDVIAGFYDVVLEADM
ncbi:hypothetical protein GY45DRAFT_1327888 [Cubamyces sp. BRFM 1775]|nr:hypothetical protein GY45DRAFT_1327888 [Cubamyces sp. BRFM 1775]